MNTQNQYIKPQEPIAHPIHPLIADRWSPRAFSDKTLSQSELNSLFESVRWSASSSNVQPWRFIYAFRSSDAHDKIVETLANGNQLWAKKAPVLMITLTKTQLESGKPNVPAEHYLGLAKGYLSLQATSM